MLRHACVPQDWIFLGWIHVPACPDSCQCWGMLPAMGPQDQLADFRQTTLALHPPCIIPVATDMLFTIVCCLNCFLTPRCISITFIILDYNKWLVSSSLFI